MLKIIKEVIFVEKSFTIPDKLSRFSRYMNYVSTNYRFFFRILLISHEGIWIANEVNS